MADGSRQHHRHNDSVSRGPIAWMAGHSVAANLLMLVFLVGGLIYAGQIKKEVFPDFELDYVTIRVPYPGASPGEVERGVILAVEEAVQGLDGIKEITAAANEGSGTVTVEIIEGKDIQRLAQDIKAEVDRITSFPDEAEDPKVTIAQRKRSVVSLALYGSQTRKCCARRPSRSGTGCCRSAHVTQVEFSGVRDYEIDISVPQAKLRATVSPWIRSPRPSAGRRWNCPAVPSRPTAETYWCA